MENMSKAVLIIGHGTKINQGTEEFLYYKKGIQDKVKVPVYHAFLEYCEPYIHTELEKMYTHGIREITVLPMFLFTGIHIMDDIPQIFTEFLEEHDDACINMLPYLYLSDFLTPYYQTRLEQECTEPGSELLLIGVGGSVKQTNDEIVELSHSIVPDWVEARLGYLSKVTSPSWENELSLMDLQNKSVVICPIILFYGRYLKMIYSGTEAFIAGGAKIKVMDPIGKDPALLHHIVTRVKEEVEK